MTDEERALTKRWVDTWVAAGPELEKVREQDIRNSVTADGFSVFAGFVQQSIKDRPPVPWSGLVYQQRWFSKMPRV